MLRGRGRKRLLLTREGEAGWRYAVGRVRPSVCFLFRAETGERLLL